MEHDDSLLVGPDGRPIRRTRHEPILLGPNGLPLSSVEAREPELAKPTPVDETPVDAAPSLLFAGGESYRRIVPASWLSPIGIALITLSIASFIVGLLGYEELELEKPGTSWKLLVTGLPLLFLMQMGGISLYKKGKHLTACSAQALLARDSRPPVLYLRSFQDDSVAAEGPPAPTITIQGLPAAQGLFGFTTMIATEEEQLAEVLTGIGPVVAIGKPGEELPELGAARLYVEDAAWQGRVRELMARAGLVVLRAGATSGIWWEVATAVAIVKPERLLFLLPYDAGQYEEFCQKARQFLPCSLPDYQASSKQAGSIRGMMYFDFDWRPHFVALKGFRAWDFSKPWVRVFGKTLRPVFEQLHAKPLKVKSGFLWVALWLFVFVPASLMVALYLTAGFFRLLGLDSP